MGPCTANARRPTVVSRCRGTTISCRVDDLRRCLPTSVTGVQQSSSQPRCCLLQDRGSTFINSTKQYKLSQYALLTLITQTPLESFDNRSVNFSFSYSDVVASISSLICASRFSISALLPWLCNTTFTYSPHLSTKLNIYYGWY